MNIKKLLALAAVAICAAAMQSCKVVKYSLSGTQIPQDAQTVSIAYIPNNAPMVAPILSSTLRDALQDRFSRQTRLGLVTENGDLAFEGEITNYTSTPAAISGDEYAIKNRLTITVKMKYTSVYDPASNYDRSFSAFLDYDSNQLLQEAEITLIPEIADMLVEDIFNAALSNW